MQLVLNKALHLNYCSNLFSGHTVNEIIHNIQHRMLPIKHHLSLQRKFAIGLWLPASAANELAQGQLHSFKDWLVAHDVYVVSMNGFPYENFHSPVVKDTVYSPDWTTALRSLYTENLIKILSELIDENSHGSISTLPISYKPWFKTAEQKQAALSASGIMLLSLIKKLHILHEKTGKCIHIDLEPEPDCLLESIDEVIEFFYKYLFPIKNQLSPVNGEEIIRTHLRVCYDICHAAVNYTDHLSALQKLQQHDIRLGKIQVSSALKINFAEHNTPAHYQALLSLAHSKYLHQVTAQLENGGYRRYPDLIAALPFFNDAAQQQWRVHYHLPIYQEQFSLFTTTQQDIIELLKLTLADQFNPHIEIETYTWPQLITNAGNDLTLYMIKEYQWLIDLLKTLHKNQSFAQKEMFTCKK